MAQSKNNKKGYKKNYYKGKNYHHNKHHNKANYKKPNNIVNNTNDIKKDIIKEEIKPTEVETPVEVFVSNEEVQPAVEAKKVEKVKEKPKKEVKKTTKTKKIKPNTDDTPALDFNDPIYNLVEEDKTTKKKKKKKYKKVIKENKHTYLYNVIILTIFTFAIEIIFRLISEFDIFAWETLRIFVSTIVLSIIISFLANLSKKRGLNRFINHLYVFIYCIYSWLQLGFLSYLGVYMSFNTSSQLGAVKDYIWDFLGSIPWNYYLIFIPFVVFIIFNLLTRKVGYSKFTIKKMFIVIPLLLFLFVCYYLTLTLKFMQNQLQVKNNVDLFINPDVPTIAINQFGTLTFGFTDLRTYLFPGEELEETLTFIPEDGENGENGRQVSSCLNELALNDTNNKYKQLNQYFASQKVSDYNDYTGLFEGKNVIFILMESVGEGIIDEENFPNFYKMYSEGYHWVNNYSPRNSCATGNNEFSAMTSLYSVYNTCTSNTYKDNKYFESVFGIFNDAGYYSTSMHPFLEWYYKRSVFHINMGSQKYYGSRDLKIKTYGYGEWPSDIEFFEKALNIVLNSNTDQPFMTWLTTITSHQPYGVSSVYGDKYMKDFKKQGYSTNVSRYLSKVKVFDNALGVLLETLEKEGKLDDTVIVMTGDHYPYGLNKSYNAEMVKHNLSNYDIEKTPLVIYNSTIEGKEFTDYSSYINILPTIANLFNLDYDPRLYVGDDLLSPDYESLVIFADGSWKNEYAYYNASKSKSTCYDETVCTTEYIKNMNVVVRNKIDMSSKAIKTNYFNYLKKELDKCEEAKKEDNSTEIDLENPV